MDEEQDQNANDFEVYYVAPERDEDTEEEMSFGSVNSDYSDSEDHSDTDEQNELDHLMDDINQNEGSNEQPSQPDENFPAINERRISYDRNLPPTHSYLGNDFNELTGRIILEEESIVTIPLLCLPGVVLVPGQLLPLQFQGSYFLSTIKNIIEGNKIFGLVSNYNRNVNFSNVYNNVKLNCLGTIVEVRSYTEENNIVLKIKAEGKERFLIKETWTERNRTVMGKVFILPEINNKHPFNKDLGLSSSGTKHNKKLLSAFTAYPNFVYELYNPEYLMDKINLKINQWASFSTNSKSNKSDNSNVYENRTVSQTTGTNQPNLDEPSSRTIPQDGNNVPQPNETTTATNTDSTNVLAPNPVPQPVAVNTTRTVVTRIVPARDSESEEEDSSDENGLVKAYAPSNPIEFSFWVCANLPLQDHQRLILLSLNSCVQRLRYEASFFEKCLSLSCINCNAMICNCDSIFSMSIKGYQEQFVNPSGFVHDTLTVSEVKNVHFQGRRKSEYSWFPGYSWQIANCKSCNNHLGWRFTANNIKLNPQYFFGISRMNVKPSIDSENNKDENPFNPII